MLKNSLLFYFFVVYNICFFFPRSPDKLSICRTLDPRSDDNALMIL